MILNEQNLSLKITRSTKIQENINETKKEKQKNFEQ